MNKNHVITIVCIFLLLLALSSCSKSSFPTGTFVVKPNIEIYRFILKGDGSWTFSEYGRVVARGNYSIHGNEFTFGDFFHNFINFHWRWDTNRACSPPCTHFASDFYYPR